MDNIRIVDDIVKDTERLFEKFYGDKDTTFVFTADHGMSNRGNHGDGGKSRLPLAQVDSKKCESQTRTTPARPSSCGELAFVARSQI